MLVSLTLRYSMPNIAYIAGIVLEMDIQQLVLFSFSQADASTVEIKFSDSILVHKQILEEVTT